MYRENVIHASVTMAPQESEQICGAVDATLQRYLKPKKPTKICSYASKLCPSSSEQATGLMQKPNIPTVTHIDPIVSNSTSNFGTTVVRGCDIQYRLPTLFLRNGTQSVVKSRKCSCNQPTLVNIAPEPLLNDGPTSSSWTLARGAGSEYHVLYSGALLMTELPGNAFQAGETNGAIG